MKKSFLFNIKLITPTSFTNFSHPYLWPFCYFLSPFHNSTAFMVRAGHPPECKFLLRKDCHVVCGWFMSQCLANDGTEEKEKWAESFKNLWNSSHVYQLAINIPSYRKYAWVNTINYLFIITAKALAALLIHVYFQFRCWWRNEKFPPCGMSQRKQTKKFPSPAHNFLLIRFHVFRLFPPRRAYNVDTNEAFLFIFLHAHFLGTTSIAHTQHGKNMEIG